MSISLSNVKEKLISLAIFFIAFDSFPIFIGGAVYRPFSFFPLLMYFIILIYEIFFEKKISKNILSVFILYIITSAFSFISSFRYGDKNGFYSFSSTAFFGVIVYSSFSDYFTNLGKKMTKKEIFHHISQKYIKAMYLPLLFGLLQVSQILIHQDFNKFGFLYKIVTKRFQSGRLFLVCGEPSWAAVYLIILFYFLYWEKEKKYRRFLLFVTALEILFTLSTFGYLAIIIMFLMFYFLYLLKNPEKLKYFFIVLLSIVIFYILLTFYMNHINQDTYTIIRIKQLLNLFHVLLNIQSLSKIVEFMDGSIFIRFINPLIGIMMACKNPLFGVGGGYYYLFYKNYIERYFPFAVAFDEVKAGVDGFIQISSRNLICRFFSEFGMGITIYILIIILSNIRLISRKDNKMLMLFSLVFMTILNFDSLFYVPFIFLLLFFIQQIDGNLNSKMFYKYAIK